MLLFNKRSKITQSCNIFLLKSNALKGCQNSGKREVSVNLTDAKIGIFHKKCFFPRDLKIRDFVFVLLLFVCLFVCLFLSLFD